MFRCSPFKIVALAIVHVALVAVRLVPVVGEDEGVGELEDPIAVHLSDEIETDADAPIWILASTLNQPQPLLAPSFEAQPATILPQEAAAVSANIFGANRIAFGTLSDTRRDLASKPGTDVIFGTESKIRVSTDSANLLGKSPSALGVGLQRRTPVVSDPRIRGARVGSLAASGSYWVPARIDLDTVTSKIDSRIISDIIVVNGPYTTLYGPGFSFMDVQLMRSPRYADGYEIHGSTSLDYKLNGQQVYGRQDIWGGGSEAGFRIGYGHATGNDYLSGNNTAIPASYNSRDLDVALGCNLSDDSFVEFNYLRLDQSNMEFPGQAFDIDFLVTDGYEIEYVQLDQPYYDRFVMDAWYNRTRFQGSAQRLGKRQQFPFYDLINFVGSTDVDSMSTGLRNSFSWEDDVAGKLTAGFDFRHLKQELNEITSGRIGLAIWNDANSPIPDSFSANPGGFVEYVKPISDETTISAGVRVDLAKVDVTADPSQMANLGLEVPQHSLAQILGTDAFAQNFSLWSGFLTGKHELTDALAVNANLGYAERPPNLTELYAAQPFMFLIQNGLNTVTGDPTLAPERMIQAELGINFDNGWLRGGARGFHAWVRDYITFEATRTLTTTQLEQVSLQYVNTELATLAGAELYGEFDWDTWLTPFATMRYVEGRDHTRNGTFATKRVSGGNPKTRVYGLARGTFSGLGGGPEEPLPGILPLEGRIGVRLHETGDNPSWTLEVSARIVDQQDRVAASLAESTTPGFTVYDLRGTWRATEHFRLVGGVENFTDKNYREHLDYRSQNGIQVFQPGVNFYGGGELSY